MDLWDSWSPAARTPVWTLACGTLAYCAYHYGVPAERALRRGASPVRAWTLQRVGGAVLLGLVPALLAVTVLGRTPAELGLGVPDVPGTLKFVAVCLGVLAPMLFLATRSPVHQARYPELRAAEWTRGLVWTNAWTWSVYLVGYELFFRGFLLSGLIEGFGVWPGVAATTALYVLVHLNKGAGEALGCVPMGVVFAWMTLQTGAIWAAVFTHVGIALCSDFFSVRHNPSMRFAGARPRGADDVTTG